MKRYTNFLFASILTASLISCDGSNTEKETSEGVPSNNNTPKVSTQISSLKYDDTEHDFDQKYVYANLNSVYKSYRVLYLNYDKSEDSDYGERIGNQQKIVVGLFNPKDGEFKPGKYTWAGDENGMNKIAVQVETSDGLKSCNYAGIDDPGFVEVIEVSKDKIVGEFHVNGKGFEISGSFNVPNEPVK